MDRNEVINIYCAAWDEEDPARRDAMLAPIWADGATYTDPMAHVVGRSALVEHIGSVRKTFPGARIERISELDQHNHVARFGWKMVFADGKSLADSVDVVTFSDDNKLTSVTGFFGPLKPVPTP